MAQFSYDVVPHAGGWAIRVTLGQLRFAGFAFNVQVGHEPAKKAAGAR
jgi:hypothetical protein